MNGVRLWPAVLTGWALAAVVLLIATGASVYALGFPDPDDALRLIEARDWLGGQSWWDVGQHRLFAGDLHWSRLVDLPLAIVIAVTQPLLGQAVAERAALVIVPLLTLLAVLALVAGLTRRLAGIQCARLAVLVAPLSVPLLYQLRPMRIDHHGWQVVLALAALYLLTGKPALRTGALAGICLAALVTISLEGLPVAAALCGIAALAWALDPARRPQLLGMVWGLAGGAFLLHVATRGIGYAAPLCDAVTADWLLVLLTAAAGTTLATLLGTAPLLVRVASLGLAGAAAAGVLFGIAPECVGGPFAQLDPLTRAIWYENVSEGLPVWQQFPSWAAMTVGLPLVGLAGSVLAFRRSEGETRAQWAIVIAALAAAFLLSLLVMRAGATANAFAVPGAAWALFAMLTHARAIPSPLKRTLATAGALLAVSPGLVAVALLGMPKAQAMRAAQQRYETAGRPTCIDFSDARAVGTLPRGMIFAPLDISPDLVATTHHRAVASGHHRNMAAMHDVIAAFTAGPEEAHAIVRRYGAAYVAVCPGLNEPELYRARSPDGFWARLERGERFAWLEPVPMPGSPVRVWKVIG